MKYFLNLLLVCFFILSQTPLSSKTSLEAVKNFNLKSYMGTWHQIATIPMWFQRNCVSKTTAHYALTKDGVEVTNSCLDKEGKVISANALARVNPNLNSPAKLEVTFANLFGYYLWFLSGDYWVVDLDEDYTTAVIGEPKLKYLWILSRNERLNQNQLIKLEHKIAQLGYDTCAIKVTQEGPLNQKNLCEVKDSMARHS